MSSVFDILPTISPFLPNKLIYTQPLLRPKKKSCLFPVTLPLQVFIEKYPYPKVVSALQTPNP